MDVVFHPYHININNAGNICCIEIEVICFCIGEDDECNNAAICYCDERKTLKPELGVFHNPPDYISDIVSFIMDYWKWSLDFVSGFTIQCLLVHCCQAKLSKDCWQTSDLSAQLRDYAVAHSHSVAACYNHSLLIARVLSAAVRSLLPNSCH